VVKPEMVTMIHGKHNETLLQTALGGGVRGRLDVYEFLLD
jgi:hypothetical protein